VGETSIEFGVDDRWKIITGIGNLFNEGYLIQGNATLGHAEHILAGRTPGTFRHRPSSDQAEPRAREK